MIDDGNNIKYNFDLNGYKHFLIEDFKENNDVAELALTLSFTNAPSMEAWVKGIEGNGLYGYSQTLPFKGILSTDIMTSIKTIQYKNQYFEQDEENLYQFFTKKEFSSYEDLVQNNRYYYVYDINFFKNIDSLLLSKLLTDNGYSKIPKSKGVYKKLKENISLKLIPRSYTKHSEIAQYFSPEIHLEINNKDFPLLDYSDFRKFVLLMSKSFIAFYWDAFIFKVTDEYGVIPESHKKDEPIIKMGESKFILTNSEEKLKVCNKYIYMTLELYYHYFKVFEKYIATTV